MTVGTTSGDCQLFVTIRFPESKFRNERTATTGPGAAETAASLMGFGVSGSHERRSIKFSSSLLWGCRRCKGAASSLVPECLSSSSSASIFVTRGCRQLLGSCHFARPQSESVTVFVCHRLRLSASSPVSVFVSSRHSARWFVQRASAVGPMFYIEGLETTVACVFKVCAVLRKVR